MAVVMHFPVCSIGCTRFFYFFWGVNQVKFFVGLIIGIIMLVMFMSCFSQASFVITYYILAVIGFAVFGVLIYFVIKTIFKMK
jgi:hypothetical protein